MGYVFIILTVIVLAAVPVALLLILISFMKHLKQSKLEKGKIDLLEEMKAFVKPKE